MGHPSAEPVHRVLVVDEEPNIVDIVSMALRGRDGAPGGPRPRAGTADRRPGSLFERFWRHEGGRRRGRGGAGLGLAVVAAIVDAHAGSVTASDAPGGGASFVVELPAAPGDARA